MSESEKIFVTFITIKEQEICKSWPQNIFFAERKPVNRCVIVSLCIGTKAD